MNDPVGQGLSERSFRQTKRLCETSQVLRTSQDLVSLGTGNSASIGLRLSSEGVSGVTRNPGHFTRSYFFLAGGGGAAAVSWWKTATHFPFRSVQTVEEYVVPGNG